MPGRLYNPINLPPLQITTGSLPGVTSGSAYSASMSATGGVGGYTWAILSATPNTGSWLSISSGGVLSGTPTTAETEVVLIKVQDDSGTIATAFFTIAVSGSSGFYPAGHWVQSNLPLTIVAPFAGLTTANRYYKQYPGIAYRVPVNAQGGAYPYVYTLTAAPSGMTIGQTFGSTDYGIINWPNPVVGTYTCTVQVQDQSLTTQSVTWTLTVTTSGFVFVDNVNGSPSVANGGTGTGTLANPLKTFDDIYSGVAGHAGTNAARKADTTWSSNFVYLRGGTYTTAQVNFEAGNAGQRAPMVSGNKPKVWIGYPGETVTLDTTGSYIEYYADNSVGYWFSNMKPAGMESTGGYKWVAFQGPASDTGFFELPFTKPTQTGGIGTNPDMIFMVANAPSIATRVCIKNCIFPDSITHEYVEAYDTDYVCIHTCTVAGINDTEGFYAKLGGNNHWSIREITALAANIGRGLINLDNFTSVTNFEISYCNIRGSQAGIYYGKDPGGTGISNGGVFRNTWVVANHTIDNAPVTTLVTTNDVMQFSSGSANSHGYVLINGGTISGATFTGEECVGAGPFVDSSGNLTGSNRTNYLGLRGHEVA